MKKQLILVFSLLTTFGFAQKKEYRSALKKFNAGDVAAAAQILADNAQILSTADAKLAPSITFLEGKIAASNKEFSMAIEKFQSAAKAGYSASEVDVERQKLVADLVNSAIEDNDKKAFLDGADKLYMAYQIAPEMNQDYLYYAASGAINGQDFTLALKYYEELKQIPTIGKHKQNLSFQRLLKTLR